jgi:hypothetical protein
MKYVIVTQDEEVAEAAKSPAAFPPMDKVIVCKDWQKALDQCDGADMIFVDLLATLDEPHKIAGYERFAHAKMNHEAAKDVPLVLIAAPKDYDIDFMVGWPDFMIGQLPRPVTDKLFRRASTWI